MEIFRTFEHNGKVLQLATLDVAPAATPPAVNATISAPGARDFEIVALGLSAETVAPGEALTLTAQISGQKIAFIYTEILYADRALNQLYGPLAREFVHSAVDKEVRGVSHPDWGAAVNLSLTLTPCLRLLTDGSNSAFAFLLPGNYANPHYRLDGLYTPADGAAQRRARLTFDSTGEMKKALVFTELGKLSTPHALTFNPGDQFCPFVQILTPPAGESAAWQVAQGLSTPLVFQGQPFHWAAEPPLPGEYLAGLVIEDLDGQLTRQYVPFTLA